MRRLERAVTFASWLKGHRCILFSWNALARCTNLADVAERVLCHHYHVLCCRHNTAPSAAAAATGAKHNSPSFYSMRSTLACEVSLMQQQLGTANLPADIWSWYMQRAGRSEDSTSHKTYINNYTSAFGNRLNYLRDAGRALQIVQFRQSMLGWCVCCAPRT
jgi:hypothetical protein